MPIRSFRPFQPAAAHQERHLRRPSRRRAKIIRLDWPLARASKKDRQHPMRSHQHFPLGGFGEGGFGDGDGGVFLHGSPDVLHPFLFA